jgi:hypothetical protein
MPQQVKFTQEELDSIKQVQGNYQTIGLDLVQIELAIINTKNQLDVLETDRKMLTERILEINASEKQLAKQLEEKYGKGEIDLESGVFTPIS